MFLIVSILYTMKTLILGKMSALSTCSALSAALELRSSYYGSFDRKSDSRLWSGWHVITIGVLIIRIGFWGSLYYNFNKEPPN